MHPFSVYNQAGVPSDYPIVVVSGDISVLDDEDYREQINDSLSDATDRTFGYPQEAIDEISDVLKEFDMELPEVSIDDTGGEMIFCLGQVVDGEDGPSAPEPPVPEDEIESTLYLYIYYEFDENQKYHFMAELVDDEGLSELLETDPEDAEESE